MTDTTEARDIIETARLSTEPRELALGKFYAVAIPGGVQKFDLTGDEFRDAPRRKAGTVTVTDVASFAANWAKHADASSEIYADRSMKRITAIFDAHNGVGEPARFGQHRGVLQLAHSPSWLAWTDNDGQPMKQEAFAEFLEDNRPDIFEPPAAEMLEIASSIQGVAKADFAGGTNLANGAKQLTFTERVDATAGPKKNLVIPGEFKLAVQVFDGATKADELIARFRYRVTRDGLVLLYKLHRPTDVVNTAFEGVIHEVTETTGATVLRGTPTTR